MTKKSYGMLGNIMALALMAESFDQSFLMDDNKGTNKLTPKDNKPETYTDLLTWLELHPEIVGKAFITHLINGGYTNDDLN